MIGTRHSVPLALWALAVPFLSWTGGAAAQERTGGYPLSLQGAIEEVRRTPFHASRATAVPPMGRAGVRLPPQRPPLRTPDSGAGDLSGGNVFFLVLPVAAVLDVIALAEVGDSGFALDPLVALGAVAAPALVARLTGARTLFALGGSVFGFGSGSLMAKAFDRAGVFLAPALHAGATAMLSVLGDRSTRRYR